VNIWLQLCSLSTVKPGLEGPSLKKASALLQQGCTSPGYTRICMSMKDSLNSNEDPSSSCNFPVPQATDLHLFMVQPVGDPSDMHRPGGSAFPGWLESAGGAAGAASRAGRGWVKQAGCLCVQPRWRWLGCPQGMGHCSDHSAWSHLPR